MSCFYPREAWFSKHQNFNGKRNPVFQEKDSMGGSSFLLPCRQCQGCRQESMRQWGVRCVHEAQMWPENCFITLTYDDSYLDYYDYGSLIYKDFSDFLKRLRERDFVKDRFDPTVRYFGCGEYGGKHQRPHFHACLFNLDFPDRVFFKMSPSGHPIYTSELLSSVWKKGHVSVQDFQFETARYTAGYVAKKVNGLYSLDYLKFCCIETRDELRLEPEAGRQSQSIGITWLEKYYADVYPADFCLVNGVKGIPPEAYDKWYMKRFPDEFEDVKQKRVQAGLFRLEHDRNVVENIKRKRMQGGRKLDTDFEERLIRKRLIDKEKTLMSKICLKNRSFYSDT